MFVVSCLCFHSTGPLSGCFNDYRCFSWPYFMSPRFSGDPENCSGLSCRHVAYLFGVMRAVLRKNRQWKWPVDSHIDTSNITLFTACCFTCFQTEIWWCYLLLVSLLTVRLEVCLSECVWLIWGNSVASEGIFFTWSGDSGGLTGRIISIINKKKILPCVRSVCIWHRSIPK